MMDNNNKNDDVMRMTANVARSRGHMAKQIGIIARLTEGGHADAVGKATRLLKTMQGHLDTELDMLARYKAEAAERAKFKPG